MKSNKLSLFEIIVGTAAIISCVAAVLVVPEARILLGLDAVQTPETSFSFIAVGLRKIILFAFVITLGLSLLLLIRHVIQPIRWDFSGFLGMNAIQGRDIHVTKFQAKGFNETSQNFRKVKGFIESNINSERIEILLDSMPPDETHGIPSKGEFWISALFRDADASREGVQAEKFLQRFSDFTFVLYLGNRKYQQRFPRKVVEKQITSFWKESNPPPKSSITKKNN